MNKPPPQLSIEKGYEFWKMQLNSWMNTTEIPKAKFAHMVILHSCNEKLQQELYSELNPDDLLTETGLKTVTDYLDRKYLKSDSLKQYIFFDEFVNFTRSDDCTILDFVEEFERKVSKLNAAKCPLPDAVLAHTLVKNVGLSDTAKATLKASCTDMTFEEVKKTLLRIYTNNFGSSNQDSTEIKSEVLYNRNDWSRGYSRGSYGEKNHWTRGSSRGSFGERSSWEERKNQINPETGKPKVCFTCGAETHLARDCPQKKNNNFRGKNSNFRGKRKYPTYFAENDNDDSDQHEVNISFLNLSKSPSKQPRL